MGQRASEKLAVVLVVEDEPLLLLASIELVENLGYRTLEASKADDAISILETHPEITVVFTDIQMAGSMDGVALSNWAADRWPPLRFIIVSGGLKPKVHEMPVDAVFLTKPFTSAAISNAISGFLGL